MEIVKSLTIRGATTGTTTLTSDADNPTIGIFDDEAAPVVTLAHLDISGNKTQAGVEASQSVVTIVDSSVDRNPSASSTTDAEVTVQRSQVDGNTSGGILSFGELRVLDSTVAHNATIPNGFGAFGITVLAGSTTISRTTVDANGSADVYLVAGQVDAGLRVPCRQCPGPARRRDRPLDDLAQRLRRDRERPGRHGDRRRQHRSRPTRAPASTPKAVSTTVSRSTITGTTKVGIVEPGALPGAPGGVVYVTQEQIRTAKALFAARKLNVGVRKVSAVVTPHALAAATPGISLSSTILKQSATIPDCSGPVVDAGYNLSADAKNTCSVQHRASTTWSRPTRSSGTLGAHGGPTLDPAAAEGQPGDRRRPGRGPAAPPARTTSAASPVRSRPVASATSAPSSWPRSRSSSTRRRCRTARSARPTR